MIEVLGFTAIIVGIMLIIVGPVSARIIHDTGSKEYFTKTEEGIMIIASIVVSAAFVIAGTIGFAIA